MMSEPTPGADALSIPAQDTALDVDARAFGRSRDLARVIDQSIHPGRTPAARPRHRAEPAHEALPATAPVVPRVYSTPVWVPTQAAPHQAAPSQGILAADPTDSTELSTESAAEDPEWTRVARREDLLRHARWRTPRNGRVAVALLLVGALFAAVATGTDLLERQSTPTLALALSCLLAASGLYAILVATTPTIVELDEVVLAVRHHARTDTFDLTHPYEDVQVGGEPGTAKWTLRLGCPDGRTVVVNGTMVDSRRLAPVVAYAQEYAQRGRDAREERFNR
jgi:hypothetical protein